MKKQWPKFITSTFICAGETGLLIGPLIPVASRFRGYLGRKEATEKKILRDVFMEGDQYFNTGDLLKLDKDYYVYFNDRVGDTFRFVNFNSARILTSLSGYYDYYTGCKMKLHLNST